MAKKYEQYYDEQLKKEQGIAQNEYDKTSKVNKKNTTDYINSMNSAYDTQINNQRKITDNAKAALDTTYQKSYDQNDIQAEITKRQLAEANANAGLTNSGLNRTQQTAVEVARMNQRGALTQQKNARSAALEQELSTYLADVEAQKTQTAAQANYDLNTRNYELYSNLQNTAKSNANSVATNLYNTDVTAETARYKAQVDAATDRYKSQQATLQAYYKQQSTNQTNLAKNMETVRKNIRSAGDVNSKCAVIQGAIDDYGLGKSEAESLCKTAGIGYDSFMYYLNGVDKSKYDSVMKNINQKWNEKKAPNVDIVFKSRYKNIKEFAKTMIDNDDSIDSGTKAALYSVYNLK